MSTVSVLNANGFNFKEVRYEPCTVTIRNADGVTVKEGLKSTPKANGIEEDDTYARWKSATGYENHAAFLNNLTEEELDKNIWISMGSRGLVGTYREYREIYLTRKALFEHAKQLAYSSGSDMSDKTDPFILEFEKVERLRIAVSWNEDGALARAKAYLQELREPKDTITLSADANNNNAPLTNEYKKVSAHRTAVERNMEDALALARSYRQGLRDPKDSITLSADAVRKLYTDAQETPPARLDP